MFRPYVKNIQIGVLVRMIFFSMFTSIAFAIITSR